MNSAHFSVGSILKKTYKAVVPKQEGGKTGIKSIAGGGEKGEEPIGRGKNRFCQKGAEMWATKKKGKKCCAGG